MMFTKLFCYKPYRDQHGQTSVETMLLTAVLVVFLAAALCDFLPYLGKGFMGIAKVIGGPIP